MAARQISNLKDRVRSSVLAPNENKMKSWVKFAYYRILGDEILPSKIIVGYQGDYLVVSSQGKLNKFLGDYFNKLKPTMSLQDFIKTGAKYKKKIRN